MLALDTGGWRTERPVLDKSLCNYCGLCSLYCPPQCMKDKGDHYEADLVGARDAVSAPTSAPGKH